ncbi:MAG: HU family DNA-binding protein [Solirubrobacterales bacterium]|nr:HU family DNA-binding protein [Solirubrobacterales bacterium]
MFRRWTSYVGRRIKTYPSRGGTVTKQEFITQVKEKTDLTSADAAKAVDAVLDTISETLKRGGEVAFTGFGKFSVSDRSARQGVNPQTGETIQIKASKVPKFSAGAKLKQTVKGG